MTLQERGLIPHHGLDLRDPDERYSAGQFSRDARGWIHEIKGRGRVPLLVGGTGFFLKALTQPMFQEPELDQERLDSQGLSESPFHGKAGRFRPDPGSAAGLRG